VKGATPTKGRGQKERNEGVGC